MIQFYVYYIDRKREVLYTFFSNREDAEKAAKTLGGYIK